ncbi:MAG: RES family NAD+ phosphorylase [Zoogloeaceae bacterium]|jgi:hypothetical protein|nr:RES family NAD+ phosphorylase [Zoogloeaceae bacterium]
MPIALASESRDWARAGWRAVEAQHKVATMGLAHGSLADQAMLEHILEEAKPRLPPDADALHWLLATPFRYASLSSGSRFRRRHDPGVFYGAEERQTACAESGYWRLRFWMDSAFLSARRKTAQLTLFEFHGATRRALDLSSPPFAEQRALWTHPSDYSHTQALADAARQEGMELIRYESARNPGGICVAILTPGVFKAARRPYRNRQEGWTLHITPPHQVVWQRDLSGETWAFDFST